MSANIKPAAPSWQLEVSVLAFVILLALALPDLLVWVRSWT